MDSEFKLTLDQKIHRCGDQVNGFVIYTTTKSVRLHSLYLFIFGVEHCSYVFENKTHEFTDGIFRKKVQLVADEVFEPGQFAFRFEFDIPIDLPPTHTIDAGIHAEVRYGFELLIREYNADKETQVLLEEIYLLDPQDSMVMLPCDLNCMHSWTVIMTPEMSTVVLKLYIEKHCLLPGQLIRGSVEVANNTALRLGGVLIELQRNVGIIKPLKHDLPPFTNIYSDGGVQTNEISSNSNDVFQFEIQTHPEYESYGHTGGTSYGVWFRLMVLLLMPTPYHNIVDYITFLITRQNLTIVPETELNETEPNEGLDSNHKEIEVSSIGLFEETMEEMAHLHLSEEKKFQ